MVERIWFSNNTFRSVSYMVEPYAITYEVPPHGEIVFSLKGRDIVGDDQLELEIRDDWVSVWLMSDVDDLDVEVRDARQIAEGKPWRTSSSLSKWDRKKFYRAELGDAEARIAVLTDDRWTAGDDKPEVTAERVADLRSTVAKLTAILKELE